MEDQPSAAHPALQDSIMLFPILKYIFSYNDSCNDAENCRRPAYIMWICVMTVLLVTWNAFHPNVPAAISFTTMRMAMFCRGLKMMVIAMVAPELVAGFAVRQFKDARELSKVACPKSLPHLPISQFVSLEYGLSLTHAYFFASGGFVDWSGYIIAAKEQLDDPEILEAIRSVDAQEMKDKSKPEAVVVTLWAVVWLCVYLAIRRSRNLPATGLEYATLAFAIMNLITWRYWKYKPLRAYVPWRIGVKPLWFPQKFPPSAQLPSRIHVLTALVGNRTGDDHFSPLELASVPEFWSTGIFPLDAFKSFDFFLVVLPSIVFGAIHCAAWTAVDFPTSAEIWLWKASSLTLVLVPLIVWSMFLFVRRAGAIPTLILWPSVLTYVVARLVLIGLSFAQWRSLSGAVLTDVSVFLPNPLRLVLGYWWPLVAYLP
ncbi:hypothetical protein FB45DRAFT_1051118 [Roridomyces roridus]|uniref:Uncharacterized protein n=1 Tax=Roridomyces roridus TaxID=1738132 RepID=A0AAD7G232_9AGAR|nr:hypothetical protein FB45DRAFT_1051118 [Roridomyces roridus]